MAISSVSPDVPPAEDLDRFARAASHGIAEPLRLISGCLELIRDGYGSRPDPDFDDLTVGAMDHFRQPFLQTAG